MAGIHRRFGGTVGKISAELHSVTSRSALIIIICFDVDLPLLPPFWLDMIIFGRCRFTIMLPPRFVTWDDVIRAIRATSTVFSNLIACKELEVGRS